MLKSPWQLGLILGTVAASLMGAPHVAQANQQYFNVYQDNAKKQHKVYTSKKRYDFKQTFTFDQDYQLKMRHVYVYQVAKKQSRYRTWMKVTGTATNRSKHGEFRFGRYSINGVTNRNVVVLKDTSLNFVFSPGTSKSPQMLSTIVNHEDYTDNGLRHGKSEKFELLLHSKKPVKRVGRVLFHIRTVTPGQFYRGESYLNLN
ncbi:MAG TPA: hypothetical protein H9875_02100 [Candidatus Levilactobacillus faecigallinarum]|uniref:DUF4352 domain-containing protein n=1 Tax=Candidatus Levilactobacillus faecigallinarum TaxID=2838638 RepID=A0A9D1U412_9LACO|nr:hypothetical protein [Candidatus Levilactobacillus faecigallinarum]